MLNITNIFNILNSNKIIKFNYNIMTIPYYKLYNSFVKENNIDKTKYINYISYNNNIIDITVKGLIKKIYTEASTNKITLLISPLHKFNYLFDLYIGWSNCDIRFVYLDKLIAVKYTFPIIQWKIKDNYKIVKGSELDKQIYKSGTISYCYYNNKKYIYKTSPAPHNIITMKYLDTKDKPNNFIELVYKVNKYEHIYNYLGYTINDITQQYQKTYVPQILNILYNLEKLGFCRTDNKPQNFTYIYHNKKKEITIKNYKIQSNYEWCLIDIDNIYYYSKELSETSKIMFVFKCLIKMNNKYINTILLPDFLIFLYENTDYKDIKNKIFKDKFNKKLLIKNDKINKYYIYERYTPEILYCCFVFLYYYNTFNDMVDKFDKINLFMKIPILFPNKYLVNTIEIVLNNDISTALDLLQ